MVTREWGEFAYAPPANVHEGQIVLDKEESHHLFRVRRVGRGATVYVTTGDGVVYECLVEGERALKIVQRWADLGELPISLTLCMAMLKGDTNRDIVDLATQMGVSSIIFFRSERSEGRLLPDKLVKLRSNAIAAIKQCGRARIPKITVALNLSAALAKLPEDADLYLAHPKTEDAPDVASWVTGTSAALVVGPEGGLTSHEIEVAMARNAAFLNLGNRRLRAETAAAVGLSYLLNRLGEIAVFE